MKENHTNQRLLSFIAVILIAGLACNFLVPTQSPIETPAQTGGTEVSATAIESEEVTPPGPSPTQTAPIPLSQGPRFAAYVEMVGDVTPLLTQESILPDLSNVLVPFVLSKAQLDHLGRDGFSISPGVEKEFFTIYEKARYNNQPVLVTSDSMLHVYHLLFSKVLRTAETDYFIPLLRQLNQAMLVETDSIYQQLQGTQWDEAARRTVGYIAVASKLLDPDVSVPAYALDWVMAELDLINQASGIHPSPLFPGLENGEDYTQYIPRGHYTKTEELKAYFRSMMWYGRMTFRLKALDPETGRAETRSALLLVYALQNAQVNGNPAVKAWSDLYSPTVFFVGRSDDLTVVQYQDVINAIYGQNASLQGLVDESKLDRFIDLAEQLPPPRILGMVIVYNQDEEQVTKGLRFMGQRFVPDAYIFRQLIFDNVGTLSHRRGLPKGLDLLAAMGSDKAYAYLDQSGDTGYENYPQQMDKVRTWLNGLSVDEWTETLNNTWLYTFFPLLDKPGDGYPNFMRTDSWLDKQLNTALGSWAELKHDTILYAKQVYAELGGGPPPPPPVPPRGYVEPIPIFYARLEALTKMTRTGLDERGLLSDKDRDGLQRLENLANDLYAISIKELHGEPLAEDEFTRIRYYGGELEELTILSADVEETGPGGSIFMEEQQQAAVIADVATDPDPVGSGFSEPIVLEVGVGRVNEIFAIVPIVEPDGSQTLQVVKGGVFSYYEFPWPAQDRLTDEKWHSMLDAGQAPELLPWTSSFFVKEGEYADLSLPIINYQTNATWMLWDPPDAMYNIDTSTEMYRAELQSLVDQKQYIGHTLVSYTIRSFDLQSPNLAVVTVREVWQDKLYSFSGDYPNYDEASIGERGPYTMDVTYTLNLVESDLGSHWAVSNVVFPGTFPEWH